VSGLLCPNEQAKVSVSKSNIEKRVVIKIAAYVHSFAVGVAIVLRRPWRRMLNCDTKDKNLFKSLIDKCQPEQKLNRITGDDRRFASPPAAAKLHVRCSKSHSKFI
jgi:hypothetical protein